MTTDNGAAAQDTKGSGPQGSAQQASSASEKALPPGAEGLARGERPGDLNAVPVRHPWRWLSVAVILVLVAMFLNMVLTNEAFDWQFIFQAMNQNSVLRGLVMGTLVVTVLAMVIGVSMGVLLAIMRLSPNPVLSFVSFVFIWFFRGVPRYVLLATMGSLGVVFPDGVALGVPFDQEIMGLLGLDGDMRFATLDANQLFGGIIGGALGLGLSEAAYMAEIARAGILSVDKGQTEAAQALGMSPGRTMSRIVLPQAMRVIIPPTGNEIISMVKDTSLLLALPVTIELFYQLRQIGSRFYMPFQAYVAGIIFYLIITTVLMIGQYYLERYFGRGYGQKKPKKQTRKATS